MSFSPPKQARSQAKLDRLVTAMQTALTERRFEHLTVIEIAERASVSPAWLYTRFKGKEELLEYLVSEHTKAEVQWAQNFFNNDQWESCLLIDRWTALVEGLFEWASKNQGLLRNQFLSSEPPHQFTFILIPAQSWLQECEDEIDSATPEITIKNSIETLKQCAQSTAMLENSNLLIELLKKNPPQ